MSIFDKVKDFFTKNKSTLNPAGAEMYNVGQYGLGYQKNEELLKEMKGWVYACFPAGTPITTDNGVRNIEDLEVDDIVYNHIGKLDKVIELKRRNYSGSLFGLRCVGLPAIRATEEHPFFIERKGKREWMETKDIKIGDSLLSPVINDVKDKKIHNIKIVNNKHSIKHPNREYNQDIKVDKDLMLLTGYYLAEGNVRFGKSGSGNTFPKTVQFSFSAEERDYIEEVEELMQKCFGIEHFLEVNCHNGTTVCILFNSRVACDFFLLFKRGAFNKTIPDWIMKLPNNKIELLLRGLWRGDGFKNRNDFYIDTISPSLVDKIRVLLLRLGIVPYVSVKHRDREFVVDRFCNCHDIWRLRMGGRYREKSYKLFEGIDYKKTGKSWNAGKSFCDILDGYARFPIRSIEIENVENFSVFNLEVENEHSYLAYGVATHNCVNAIADELANMKILLYERKGDKIEQIKDDPILTTLYKVNDFTTKFDLFWLIGAYLELTGEAPLFLEKDSEGNVTDIFFLNPSKFYPIADKKNVIRGYKYDIGKGVKVDIPTDEIIFIKYPNPARPFRGLGTLEAAAKTVDTENYAEAWNLQFYKNSARADAIITVDQKQMTKEQKVVLKESVKREYQGTDKAHKLMIMFGGMEYKQIATTQKDMDFNEQLKSTRDKIFGIFRVPKAIVAQTEGVNYASAKMAAYIFARWTMQPKMERIIQQLNEFYVPLFKDSENKYLEFENPIPEDDEQKLKENTQSVNKWRTINEIRETEGRPPMENGDEIYLPLNLYPIGSEVEPNKEPQKSVVKVCKVLDKDKVKKGLIPDERAMQMSHRQHKSFSAGQMKEIKNIIKNQIVKEIENGSKPSKQWNEKKKRLFWQLKNRIFLAFVSNVRNKQRKVFKEQESEVLSKLNKFKGMKKSFEVAEILLNKNKETLRTIKIVMPALEEVFKESGDNTFKFLGVDMETDVTSPKNQKILKSNTTMSAVEVTALTNSNIRAQVAEGLKLNEGIADIATRIKGTFSKAQSYRAEMIARTETVRANAAATLESFKDSGVVSAKEWTVEPDACQFCLPMSGKVVDLDKSFFKKGDTAVGDDGGSMKLDYSTTEYPPLHPNSYHKDTEAYTADGFKLIKDIKIGEDILSLNPKTLNMEWIKVKNLISHKQDKLISFKSRNFDLSVTPDHQMFYQKRWDKRMGRKKFEFIEAKKLPPEAIMYRSSKWQGKKIKRVSIGKYKMSSDLFCKFMGWWLSEGSVTKRGENSYQISIAQKSNYEKMCNDLIDFPIKINYQKDKIGFNDTGFGKYLVQFGKSFEKFVPDIIKGMQPKHIRVFLDAFRLGDGSTRKVKRWKGGNFKDELTYFTSSKRLADDIGELILKVGRRPSYNLQKNKGVFVKHKNGIYAGNHDIWIIRECYSQNALLNNIDVKDVEYNDTVYCVELEKYHTLYVRKNGKCVWSGNCRCDLAPIIIED